jgi:hypothetical protein
MCHEVGEIDPRSFDTLCFIDLGKLNLLLILLPLSKSAKQIVAQNYSPANPQNLD